MVKFTGVTRARWARLLSDRRGGVAVLTAMSLSSVLGFAGLATEASVWYVAKRSMQGAADAAAFSAATAEAAGENATGFDNVADAVATQYGYTNGTNNVTVTINNPPKSGNYTTNSSAVEVVISQPQQLLFSALFMTAQPTIVSRAVAVPGTSGGGGGGGCVLALDKGSVTDVTDSGSTQLNLNACNLDINSPSSSALNISGSAAINAQQVNIVGNYTKSGTASITGTVDTGATAATDPYASVSVPSYSGCNQTRFSVTGAKSVGPTSPGGVYVFCDGVTVSGSGNLTLAPGTYIVTGGNFSVSGGATVTGTGGVTIITTGSGTSYGTVQISGSSNVTIDAPTSGPLSGIAFYGDRAAPATNSNNFSGGTTQNIKGALYFPSQQVTYSGGSATGSTASPCTQLIADQLSFSGSSNFNSNCAGTGVQAIGGGGGTTTATKLLE